MDNLLDRLRFETYRLEVLTAAPPSPTRDAAIRSAVSGIQSVLDAIRRQAND